MDQFLNESVTIVIIFSSFLHTYFNKTIVIKCNLYLIKLDKEYGQSIEDNVAVFFSLSRMACG